MTGGRQGGAGNGVCGMPKPAATKRCSDNPPNAVLSALNELGFQNTFQQRYTHKDKGQVLDLHFQKDGTDLFNGWKADECAANLAAIDTLFGHYGIKVAPRVMSLAEAYS